MRIDMHTHAFHHRVAARAVEQLNRGLSLHCEASGSLQDLILEEEGCGMDRFAVLCCAAEPEQVRAVNNFAFSLRKTDERIIPFGTVHPGGSDWAEELDRLAVHGIGGIKLHPDYQGFSMADPGLCALLEACEGRFCVLFHVGSPASPKTAPSSPQALLKLAQNFPRVDIIAAHLGGYHMWQHVAEVFAGVHCPHLWFDTSSTTAYLDEKTLQGLLRLLPSDHCFFGSDWPIFHLDQELERLQGKGGLGRTQMEALLQQAAPLLQNYYSL